MFGVNYNLDKDSFEMKTSLDSVFSISNEYINEIRVNNRKFIQLKEYTNLDGFVELLFHNDEMKLIKKFKVKLLKGKMNPLDGTIEDDKYQKYYRYYLCEDNRCEKTRLNHKTLSKMTNVSKLNIIKYVKKNNLSLNKESDFIKALSNIKSN